MSGKARLVRWYDKNWLRQWNHTTWAWCILSVSVFFASKAFIPFRKKWEQRNSNSHIVAKINVDFCHELSVQSKCHMVSEGVHILRLATSQCNILINRFRLLSAATSWRIDHFRSVCVCVHMSVMWAYAFLLLFAAVAVIVWKIPKEQKGRIPVAARLVCTILYKWVVSWSLPKFGK